MDKELMRGWALVSILIGSASIYAYITFSDTIFFVSPDLEPIFIESDEGEGKLLEE